MIRLNRYTIVNEFYENVMNSLIFHDFKKYYVNMKHDYYKYGKVTK